MNPTKKLVGYANFKRVNPKSDKFTVYKFHHVEFYCGDATNTYKRFSHGLGMQLVAKSDQMTGNHTFASYVLKSNDLTFAFTAPYAMGTDKSLSITPRPFDANYAFEFFKKHGLGVYAVGLLVEDAAKAYDISVANGAVSVQKPITLYEDPKQRTGKQMVIAEVKLYGDAVLRYVSHNGYTGPYLIGYEPVQSHEINYGLTRLDHVVGNVPVLMDVIEYLSKFTGWHEFAEFTAEDVGTIDSGLNSMVLANNNEMVLMPVNEPTFGTKRKSQIQTYLEQNEGPGVQHLALKTDDIFYTIRKMRELADCCGFEFMPRPEPSYYERMPARIGNDLTPEQYKMVEELGLLVDKDDQGTLIQIFTRPLGDRPTIFIELIQRVGCMERDEFGQEFQKGGCGGFGKGNFSELFKSIEDYERLLDPKADVPSAM